MAGRSSGSFLLAPVVALAIGVAASAAAQGSGERYAFDVPLGGEERVEGRFSLALGSITIGEAQRGQLFQVRADLQDENLRPALEVTRHDGLAILRLGFEEGSRSGVSLRGLWHRERNAWRLSFDRRTPLDLQFELGMADADLDFSGFSVERLRIRAGMASGRLRFDRRNRIEMQRLDIEAGAARFAAERLGNARFHELHFRGGAGSFELDFSGARLPAGARANIDVGVSHLRLRLPAHRPIVLTLPESRLARVSVPDGYIRQGNGVWHSPAVRDPRDALHIHIRAGLGRVVAESVPR